ncbi:MAG: hypothetical protein GXP16_01750 [Gammaproteobacteria bacterium]|nr:hypothetical protein [Gammaproteobacteria bacterium]
MNKFVELIIIAFLLASSATCSASKQVENAALAVVQNGIFVDILLYVLEDSVCAEPPDLGSNLFILRLYGGNYEAIESPIKSLNVLSSARATIENEILGTRLELRYLVQRFDLLPSETIRFLYSIHPGSLRKECDVEIGDLEVEFIVPRLK